ncbi:hypothetical protein TUM4438_31220 [Shewanella sairae]|uniref:Lipoprotein n=1 Tax=Shewanella sairae TaxID=190310 RepID=A0ABQ4PLD9_9GAMM|nr:hypothetical protein [Shewanella sairae]MCL1131892.1 hypothetical protein [Shewanella sairae]GIU48869.1 hypothetical protein TUM4438_31220 [Shewanella sairae]
MKLITAFLTLCLAFSLTACESAEEKAKAEKVQKAKELKKQLLTPSWEKEDKDEAAK